MATYITSDIHGQYDKFKALMEKINLKDEDTLYVLGDIIDRGPEPIKTMLEIMEMPNAVCIKGNHEVMALDCLEFFNNEDPERSTQSTDEGLLGKILLWQRNGRTPTMAGLSKLTEEQKQQAEAIEEEAIQYKHSKADSLLRQEIEAKHKRAKKK